MRLHLSNLFMAFITVYVLNACGIKDSAGVSVTGNTASIHGGISQKNSLGLAKKISESNSPIDFAVISLEDSSHQSWKDTTDLNGHFAFDSLAAGVYKLYLLEADGSKYLLDSIHLSKDQQYQKDYPLMGVNPLFALACYAPNLTSVPAQLTQLQSYVNTTTAGPDSLQIDVVNRDFPSTHPDFENFDQSASLISANPIASYSAFSSECYNSGNPSSDPVNFVCEDGYPCSAEHGQAYFGEYVINGKIVRTDRFNATKLNGGTRPTAAWEKPIYATRGMVKTTLNMDSIDPYFWTPEQANPVCHSSHFNQWFTDVPNVNLRTQSIIFLSRLVGTTQYEYNSDVLNPQGYFPLDSMDNSSSFGKQSLNIWCPPYVGGQAEAGDSGTLAFNTCKSLLQNGGPRSATAVAVAVAANPGAETLLHNYHFTTAIYTKMRYYAGDTFMINGSSDVWVFMDGKLVVDLGGMNYPGKARISLDQVAQNLGWVTGSNHNLNIFYAQRQTNESHLGFTVAYRPQLSTDFGGVNIRMALLSGEGFVDVGLSDQLADSSASNIASADGTLPYHPIVVRRTSLDSVGTKQIRDIPLAVQSLCYLGTDSASGLYFYRIHGSACLDSTCQAKAPLQVGDSLVFNPLSVPHVTSIHGKLVQSWFSWTTVTQQ